MCGGCCKLFKGWCRSFTKTETFLSILAAILLIVFIAFLTFVVLHFIACSKKEIDESTYPGDKDRPLHTTVAPGVECTWDTGHPTTAGTRYYEQTGNATSRPSTSKRDRQSVPPPVLTTSKPLEHFDELLPYLSDGEDAKSYNQHVLALVKMRPPQDLTFGCILTIVSDYWVVTAASCIEAIEEVDSLDSFVMMEGYGEDTQATHAVADVLVHPWYQGRNRSYDVVALKSEDRLARGPLAAAEICSALDYFLTPIGEQLAILGYGRYRGMEQGPSGRSLRHVATFLLPPQQCAAPAERWAPRHLVRPHAAPHGTCGARALCAGALSARGAACNYCAGAPLFLGARLLGVMSDNPQCGAACEPVLYVNLALVRPWLDALLAGDDDFLA